MDVYNFSFKDASVQTILRIMEIFAIPYKAAVLRLFEEDKIDIKTARRLLQVDESEINKQIDLTGKAARWQAVTKNLIRFGNLSEQMYDAERMESVRQERLESDTARLSELIRRLNKPWGMHYGSMQKMCLTGYRLSIQNAFGKK